MDLQLNAVEDDASGSEHSPPQAPPAFTMPISRISASAGASLSSILSANSPLTPNAAPPRFELPVARRSGLASLMNSPLTPKETPHSYTHAMEAATGAGIHSEPPSHRQDLSSEDVEMQHHEQEQEQDEGKEDGEEEDGEERQQDGDEVMGCDEDYDDNTISPKKRRRSSSAGSESSVVADAATPPLAAARSPASVALHADALVLHDAELESIKGELQHAIQRFLTADAKAKSTSSGAKRKSKGKQTQQAKKRASVQGAAVAAEEASVAAESLEDVAQCITKLQDKITEDLLKMDVLREIVRLCSVFLGIVASPPVAHDATASIQETLASLPCKPIQLQLASVIRRVVFSVPHDAATVVLSDVYDWVLTTTTSSCASWSWLFAFCAQFDASTVVEFLVQRAVFQGNGDDHQSEDASLTLRVLEHFCSHHHSAALADAVTASLHTLAASTTTTTNSEGYRGRVDTALVRLLTLISRSPVLLRALDDAFQWVFTRELVVALWTRASSDDTDKNATTNGRGISVASSVLRLLDEHSDVLSNTIFQLLLLLHQLCTDSPPSSSRPATPGKLVALATHFHEDLVQIAQQQPAKTMVQGVHRRLQYIAQTVIQRVASDDGEGTTQSSVRFWTSWMSAIATAISRRDVTLQLLQADLTLCESTAPTEPLRVSVHAICGLLCSIVEPTSSDFVGLVRELSHRLQYVAVSPASRRRLLSILARLLELQRGQANPTSCQPTRLQLVGGGGGAAATHDVDAVVRAFSEMSPWHESWSQLDQWRGASGAELWEYLLDLVVGVGHADDEVSSQALQLLATTPFPSLEDPEWQFRCLHKLTSVYFHLLRRLRIALIDLDAQEVDQHVWQMHLHTLQTVIRRVLSRDGAVAHYAASVFTQFVSLWLDAQFSTASATSVPTHFPSSTKGDDTSGSIIHNSSLGISGHNVVIRSERTISSKCTNLQSSQVITKHRRTLVYRKALDDTWLREMHAAFTCSRLATGVLTQLLAPQGNQDQDQAHTTRRLKHVVEMLLERATPCCGVPSDDVYKEMLPNRSSVDMDLRIEQWLNHFPAFLPLLRVVVESARATTNSSLAQALRLLPILKSALVVLLGHWNSVKGELDLENMDVPPYMRNRNQLALSCELMRILRVSGWLPEPLARTAELLPLTTPTDIRAILFSCWFYLADHPPTLTTVALAQTHPSSGESGAGQTTMPIEFYVLPVRRALHRNIYKIGAKYSQFMC